MVPTKDAGGADGAANAERRARELVRTASHDLRSPLAAIQLIVRRLEQLRQAGRTGAELAVAISRISEVADRGLAQVERTLNADQPAADAGAPVDVEEVIEEALTLQCEALRASQSAVRVTLRAPLARAQGPWSRSCLLRIFSNLLQNASKHAPAAPIYVELARAGDRLRITFADRGPGIPSTAPMGKYVDDGSAPTGNHGLGIWIVRRGVAELNGSMKIRNAPGMGLAFAIELPGLQL